MKKIVPLAIEAFSSEKYITAENLYRNCGERYGEIFFDENQKIISRRIIEKYEIGTNRNQPSKLDPWIYFCVPVMNRLSDIQSTLRKNLDVIKKFTKTKILINLFDGNNESFQWIKDNFEEDINSGHLDVNRLDPLKFWHFSWAKNSFKNFVGDDGVYSSLDGDNYLTIDEIARTKQIFSEFGPSVIHHFSGTWGDGSSGRISVPATLFKKYGYRNELLPRQFDEISLMLNILVENHDINYFCRKSADIFQKSWFLKSFQELEKWKPKVIYANLGELKSPENPKTPDYVKRDNKMEFFTRINSNFTLLKLAKEGKTVNHFSSQLKKSIKELITSNSLLEVSSSALTLASETMPVLNSDITLYSVMKNDENFLKSWLSHYRNLGVTRFFIVDDGSKPPLSNEHLGDDVFIFNPVVGDFKNFKVFWLKFLMRQFQTPGSLCLCADADEYLDLPQTKNTIENSHSSKLSWLLENNTSLKNFGRIPGILIDLMPVDSSINVNSSNFLDTMCYYVSADRDEEKCKTYNSHPSVRWAFKESWKLAYTHDLRFHIYDTFDCLRKFPIFIYSYDIELNQGFHDLIRKGQSDSLQSMDEILPIRHYKMLKVLSHDSTKKTDGFSSYFDRTAANLEKIYSTEHSDIFQRWAKLNKKKYDGNIHWSKESN